jgi:hypothetical protein
MTHLCPGGILSRMVPISGIRVSGCNNVIEFLRVGAIAAPNEELGHPFAQSFRILFVPCPWVSRSSPEHMIMMGFWHVTFNTPTLVPPEGDR